MKHKGQYYEELVELIEKSINPNSTVERDIKLPIVNSTSGATSQCDIVITEGKPPREIITIVEVQNRNRKPDANTFRGWVSKLDKVGAQRLICVSKMGFTKTVEEEARNMRGKVMLIQLSKITEDQIPLDFIKTYAIYQEFTLEKFDYAELNVSSIDLDVYGIDPKSIQKKMGKTKRTDKIFSKDRDIKLSFQQLCSDAVTNKEKSKGSGTTVYSSIDTNQRLFIHFENVYLEFDLFVEFKWFVEVFEIPVSYLKYDQDEHGALAWLVKGKLNLDGRNVSFEMPFTKNEDGYIIRNIRVESSNDVDFILQGIEN